MPAEPQPFVSVVVPTADRRAILADCLEHVLRQDYPGARYEVIVVDDGSRDGTAEAVRGLAAARSGPAVRYERRQRRGAGAARNAGLAIARGELVCFLDDDALAPEGWLAALVDGARRNPEAGCVGGPVRPRVERRPPPTCGAHELAGMSLDHGPGDAEVDEVWGCNMALRPSAVRAAGGFDERLAVAEDWDWGRRLRAAGGRLVIVPEAWIHHRRLASDLRVSRLLLEYYRRGYAVGARDPSATGDDGLRAAAASLRHAARERCTRGLTDAARSLGLWCAGRVRRGRPIFRAGRPR
jgi:GT2 family glycosyltransferase